MSNNEPIIGIFHDALTNETVTRELTLEELALLPKPKELPTDAE